MTTTGETHAQRTDAKVSSLGYILPPYLGDLVTTARIEDLEESLRRIVTVVGHDPQHECCDRDDAVLAIALEILGLDPPP